jgi:hypothetical protein
MFLASAGSGESSVPWNDTAAFNGAPVRARSSAQAHDSLLLKNTRMKKTRRSGFFLQRS